MNWRQRGIFEKVPGSGVWWIRYADQRGRIHREKIGPKSFAIAAYQKRKTEVREARFFPEQARRVTFAQLVKDAMVSSPGSLRPDRAKRLLSWFGGRVAASITPQDIERRLKDLADQGRKPATLNRYRAALSVIFALGVRNGKVSTNPARQVRLKRENNARIRFLDEEEETRLRKAIRKLCPEREAELDLALHTGLRWGEQYGLRWEDVDFKVGVITIRRSKHGERRHVHLNSAAVEALKTLGLIVGDTGHVCPGCDRAKVRAQHRRWFEAVLLEAQIADFHWHDIRHTFASRLVMAGVDLRTVQELMGHKTIAMTVRYSHLSPSHQKEAVERLVRPTGTTTSTGSAREDSLEPIEIA